MLNVKLNDILSRLKFSGEWVYLDVFPPFFIRAQVLLILVCPLDNTALPKWSEEKKLGLQKQTLSFQNTVELQCLEN